MNSVTPTGMMIDALKDEFKAKGIHYRTVAERLKVSEATIKRYLRGYSVTLTAVEKMAEIVNLDVLSLAALAQRKSRVDRGMSKLQEEAEAGEPKRWPHPSRSAKLVDRGKQSRT